VLGGGDELSSAEYGIWLCGLPPDLSRRFATFVEYDSATRREWLQAPHITPPRSHTCTALGCGKTFALAGHLAEHTRTHTGERQFACQFAGCGKTFTQAGNLTAHTRTQLSGPFVSYSTKTPAWYKA